MLESPRPATPKSHRIAGLADVARSYRGVLCDVWGVLHNGHRIYPDAAAALATYRSEGGRVVLITNSPRPRAGVIVQLRDLGLADDAYDAIVTSGDVTRELIRQACGRVFHLGPERDLPLFDGLEVALCAQDEADVVVCTGLLDDENETPDDYREQLQDLVARAVPMICANPDIVVERGERLVWCAGALAKLYRELGGETRLAGKPHPPIYEQAQDKLMQIDGSALPKEQILAIGDGMPTDVAGAQGNGLDLLYVSAGIHAGDYGDPDNPDEKALDAFLEKNDAGPRFWIPRLIWAD